MSSLPRRTSSSRFSILPQMRGETSVRRDNNNLMVVRCMGRKRIYKNDSQRSQAYQQRRKYQEEQEHKAEIDILQNKLETSEYVDRKWAELCHQKDKFMANEFLNMTRHMLEDGIGLKQQFETKLFHIKTEIARGTISA